MSDTLTIVVPAGTVKTRLDVFLTTHVEQSRSQLQKAIKAGAIKVNGKNNAAHDHVHPGDIITVAFLGAKERVQTPIQEGHEPTVIEEDENYLVVNKPSGLVVHGGPGIHEDTLADWAVEHDPKIGDVGDQPQTRPGIVHRLDRDVSGVMVIAKSQRAFDDLKKQFQNHGITKKYIALVNGFLTKDSGKIDYAIARKPDHSGLMVARPGSTEGKAAETQFRVLKTIKGMTLVQVETLTGRTHQIRVHFKAIGHALAGDPLYRNRKLKLQKLTAPRLCLHASLLKFTDLSGKERRYEAPLPVDLQQFFARLGG
jgi:23S rRNA pseudouridine1911/1915/1917 synthase